jgi:hypothetical protein
VADSLPIALFYKSAWHGTPSVKRTVQALYQQDPDILAGKPTIKGTRMSVEFILELLAKGDFEWIYLIPDKLKHKRGFSNDPEATEQQDH